MSSAVQIRIPEADAHRLRATLAKIVATTRARMPGLLKQTFIFAVQSATKATSPGSGGRVSTLPQKYRKRPIERLPGGRTEAGYWYLYFGQDGRKHTFVTDNPIPRRGLSGLVPLRRGLKYWDKKANRWGYWPTAESGRYSPRPAGRIPGYGAAKAGWLAMLGKLGKPADLGGNRPNLGTVRQNFGDLAWIQGTNEVGYAPKTSPQAAARGIQAATSRLTKIYLKNALGVPA